MTWEVLQERVAEIVNLFVVVCLAAFAYAVVSEKIQKGTFYFVGAVTAGLVFGYIAIAFSAPEGVSLIVGVVGMVGAPYTFASIEQKSVLDVIDEIRGRSRSGGLGRGRDGNGDE